MRQSDPLEAAKVALSHHYPDSLGGFAAGSVFRGDATATSDIDLVVLYDESYDDIHRKSVIEDGWPVEFFVHNITAQDFFFEKDRLRGMCVMPSMVSSGIIIPDICPELILQQEKAKRLIQAGPPLLEDVELQFRRYMLTDAIDDLTGVADSAPRNAILSRLHQLLGDFYLRANGEWSGHSKALLRCLKDANGALAFRYEASFIRAFRGEGVTDLIALADEILEPLGGRLWAGFRADAPADWKVKESSDL